MSANNFKVEVDQTTPSEWSQWLSRFDDANLYQTWSYGAVRWGPKCLSHLVLKQGGEVVAAAQLRIIRTRFSPGGIAYLRWGPLFQVRDRGVELEVARAMAAALHAEYVRKRRLFLRILPNAFAGSERAAIFLTAFPQFKTPGTASIVDRTFLLDISPPLEAIRKKFDQKWRNQLNRAEKNGLHVIQGDNAAEYKLFLEVYDKMWNRKRFDTSVDVNEFARITDDLPKELKFKILVCKHAGQPVSAIVCSAVGNTGIYLLGATHDEGLNTKAAYLLHWMMIQQLKEKGMRYYDLGGIDPEKNPGVYHFKKGFSGDDVTRIGALECCEDIFSRGGMKAADILKDGFGGMASRIKRKLFQSLSGLKAQEKTQQASSLQP